MASKVEKDIKVLENFIGVFCESKHKDREKADRLCSECLEVLEYSKFRREVCPLDPKPSCKNCEIHCYEHEKRQKIREIMRFSGMHLIKRGRLDLLLHYIL